MKRYDYRGKNQAGLDVQGSMFASSMTVAKMNLYKEGIMPLQVHLQKSTWHVAKIKTTHICHLSRQLATLVEANVPLIDALETLYKNQKHPKLKFILQNIKENIENGISFSQALTQYPQYFNDLYYHLVYVGEQSGVLALLLEQIASHQEKLENLKNQIKNALFYPLIVLFIASLISISLLFFVVPSFETLFKNFGAELPFLTQCLLLISKYAQNYAFNGVVFILIFFCLVLQLKKHIPNQLRFLSVMTLKMPFWGNLFHKAALSRFLRTLFITLKAGIPLVNGLEITAGTSGNILFQQSILQIKKEISQGLALHESMMKSQYFSEFIIQMVAIGEESGALENMLYKCADFYEKEVDNLVKKLSHVIEPIIMSLLGLFIGGLVLALYLPIFKLGSVL